MSTVQTTNNYGMFTLLDANREVNRGHVETLKQAISEIGDLTSVQPILVNDNFEIIDGQHRYTACVELGLPINYTMADGLRITDAIKLNIMHRPWEGIDYIKSYAASGDQNYKNLLKLIEDYVEIPYSSVVRFSVLSTQRPFVTIRHGDLILSDEDTVVAREKMDKYLEFVETLGVNSNRGLVMAFNRLLKSPEYNHKRMLVKASFTQHLYKKYQSFEDNVRMLEDMYNFKTSEANKVRFF